MGRKSFTVSTIDSNSHLEGRISGKEFILTPPLEVTDYQFEHSVLFPNLLLIMLSMTQMSVPGRSLKIKQSCNCEKLDKFIFFFFFLEYLVTADRSLQTSPTYSAVWMCTEVVLLYWNQEKRLIIFLWFCIKCKLYFSQSCNNCIFPHTRGSEYRHQVTIKLRFSMLKYREESKHKLWYFTILFCRKRLKKQLISPAFSSMFKRVCLHVWAKREKMGRKGSI